jgi:Tol biopolymer transport system component
MNCIFKFFLLIIFLPILRLPAQDKFECRRLTFDPEQNGFPTWSPDSKFIMYQFFTWNDTLGKNGLWVVSPNGTNRKQIFKGIAEHPKWSPNGNYIVFDADTGNSIQIISSEGGDPVSFLPDSIYIHNGGLPCWSPDGSRLAFVERTGLSICIYDMKTGNIKSIFSKDNLLPLPGCWTKDGENILVALMDRQSRKSTIQKISVDSKSQKQIPGNLENFYRFLCLSPDGSLLIYGDLDEKHVGLWIIPTEGGISLPLAVTPNAHNEGAAWSPDGKSIAFTSTRSGNFDVWIMDVDIEQLKNELEELNK